MPTPMDDGNRSFGSEIRNTCSHSFHQLWDAHPEVQPLQSIVKLGLHSVPFCKSTCVASSEQQQKFSEEQTASCILKGPGEPEQPLSVEINANPLNSEQSILGSLLRAMVLLLLNICRCLLLHQPESGFP